MSLGRHDSSIDPIRALFGAGATYAGGRLLQLLAGVLVVPVLTRLLAPSDFGTVAAALIVVQLLALLAAAGLPAALTRMVFEGDGRDNARSIIFALMIFAPGVAVIAHLAAPLWIRAFRDLEYILPIQIAVITAVPVAIVAAAQAVLQAERQSARFVTTALVGTVGGQVIGIALLLGDPNRSPSQYLAGNFIGFSAAASLAVLFTGLRARVLLDRRPLRSALATGLPTVPHLLGLYLLAAGDRVVIERMRGLDDVGRYQVAYAVGSLGLVALTAVNNAWAPIVYGASSERRWLDLATICSLLMRLGALVAVGIAFGAPVVVRLAAPVEYGYGTLGITAAVVALSVIPYVLYLARVHVLFQVGRTKSLAVVTPLTAAGNVLLNLVAVRIAGLPGVASITAVTYCAQAFLVHQQARRLATVPWNARGDLHTGLWAVCLVAIGAFLPAEGSWLVVRGAAAAALLSALVWYVRRLMRQSVSRDQRAV